MFCPTCGAENSESNRFCFRCGGRLSPDASSALPMRNPARSGHTSVSRIPILLSVLLLLSGLALMAMSLDGGPASLVQLGQLLERPFAKAVPSTSTATLTLVLATATAPSTATGAVTPTATRTGAPTPTRTASFSPTPMFTSPPVSAPLALVKGPGKPVYQLVDGVRHWIPNSQTFEAIGYEWEEINEMSWQQLLAYPAGEPLPVIAGTMDDGSLCQGTRRSVYLMEADTKRLIVSWPVFLAHGYQEADIAHVSDEWLAGIPDGEPILE